MIDGVIFDLDGTLWDTTEELCRCWQKFLPKVSIWDIRKCMGMTPEQIAKELKVELEVVKQIQGQELFWLREHPVAPYMGVTTTLQYLKELNIPCFIVSNCQKGYIECFIDTNGYRELFKDWACYDDNPYKYNNIQTVIWRNSISNPIYVGDTADDLVATIQAKVPFLWASYGFGKGEISALAINNPMDLMRFINVSN